MSKMNGDNHFIPSSENLPSAKLLSKFSTAKPDVYVLNSAINSKKSDLAVVLSDYNIHVYEKDNSLLCSHAHEKEVTDVKYSSRDPFLLYTSSLDGKLNIWDARCQEPAQTFLDDSNGVLKPLTCFDYNLDELYICAGTELIREDSFLIFWDRRSSELLGGYWNSHTDDLTKVCFHPNVNSSMASSSVDGLINIFNLEEKSEDDALSYTLNVGSGIAKFTWTDSEHLSCTTSLEEFQLWSATDAEPSLFLSREDLSKSLKLTVDYLIDSLKIENSWFLATGTYGGQVHLWSYGKGGLSPVCSLLAGHSDVVRTISYNHKENIITTGGEDGVVCRWKLPSL